MAAMEHGDLQGCSATNIASPFRDKQYRRTAPSRSPIITLIDHEQKWYCPDQKETSGCIRPYCNSMICTLTVAPLKYFNM